MIHFFYMFLIGLLISSDLQAEVCTYVGPIASYGLRGADSPSKGLLGIELTGMSCDQGIIGLVLKSQFDDKSRMDTFGAQLHLGLVGIELGANHYGWDQEYSGHFQLFFGIPDSDNRPKGMEKQDSGIENWYIYLGPASRFQSNKLVNYFVVGFKVPLSGKLYTGRWGC
ncbi:MAG: hypothetical protein NT027_04005 [Proteobacteria bacterium]|nr:hypothetical protein [Pseudomonadota bacterium]